MDSDLESRVRETGFRLFELLEDESPSVFQREYWTGKVLEWCMQDEAFKVEMFRFIDVFPYLKSSEAVARHLEEYFSRPDFHFPAAVEWGLRHVPPDSLPARAIAKTIAGNIASMASQFVLAESPSQALKRLEKLRSQGLAFTVDLLGEAVVSEREADDYALRYLDLLDTLGEAKKHWKPLGNGSNAMDWGHAPLVNVSIKPSAMYSQMNPCSFNDSIDAAMERYRPILRKAMEHGAFVTLDMEQRGLKNLTLALYRHIMEEPEFRDYPHTGIVTQAYLRESEADLLEMIAWARRRNVRFTVRLVKGAYWDTEVVLAGQKSWPIPVFTEKHRTDANFERLARIALENHEWVNLACGSHNVRSIAYVMELSRELKVPPEHLEFQVLFGMGEPVRNGLRKAGLQVRLYTPVGEMVQGMAYLVRRLLENTANESFLRQSFVQNQPRAELLRNPALAGRNAEGPPAPSDEGVSPFRNEPQWDWALSENLERFKKALANVRGLFPIKAPVHIGGRSVKTEKEIVSTNPNSMDEIVGIAGSAGKEEAERAIQAAKAAFPAWRDTDPVKRAEILFKAADVARSMRYELAALQVFEVGKGWSEADGDVCEAIDFLEYYGREMIRLGAPRRMGSVPGEMSRLFYEGKGVSVVIAPWNFPLAISMGMTSAAIVAGNTVVYKPASQSPITG
ncbi:MAG: proline dehydrogenase family protein, partial [Acidobacteriota bacterium]